MAYIPLAQELSTKYTLTGPDGTVAVLNDPADVNYVGATTAITGLDSAEIRESAEDLVEADGGTHGYFYLGRRPITMTVFVHGHASITARSEKIDRLRRASLALRGDAVLSWALSSDPTMTVQIPVRRQQPFRETGAWNKEIALALVSEQAIIVSATQKDSGSIASGTPVVVENKGNWPAYPILRITGISSNPSVTDGHGGTFRTTGLAASGLASGETVEFDMLRHTGVFTAGARNGQSANQFIDFALTTVWPNLVTGNNTLTLSGGGTFRVLARDTWA